ncbi:MAG: TrmH family RNA methyltransferase [Pyrinomonadaceae bacterium]
MNGLEKITSRDNRRLVGVRKVRDRKVTDLILIEGVRLVGEALRSDLEIVEAYVSEDFTDEAVLGSVKNSVPTMFRISQRLFGSIADTKTPQGILVLAKRPCKGNALLEERFATADVPIVLLLNKINNPSNLGAILRTSEAAGIGGVIITEASCDAYSTRSLRASMGAAFRLPVWQGCSIEEAFGWSKKICLTNTAADMAGEKTYVDVDWTIPRLLIFGSEARGIAEVDHSLVSESMRIPMAPDVESLNLAVSAGIVLFEARRQIGAESI